jgi:hypothetical protein
MTNMVRPRRSSEGGPDALVGLHVHAGGDVVQDHDRRIGQEQLAGRSAGAGRPRADAAFADHGVVALRQFAMKSSASARRAAARISSMPASGLPNAMLPSIVSENRKTSCMAMPAFAPELPEVERSHVVSVKEDAPE